MEDEQIQNPKSLVYESLSDEDWSYETAPESPTLIAQSERRKRLTFQETARKGNSSPDYPRIWDGSPSSAERKRASDDISEESYETANQYTKRSRSSNTSPERAGPEQSLVSFGSTTRSTNGYFWSQNQDGGVTANTSFVSDAEHPPEPKELSLPSKVFHSSGTVSFDDIEMYHQADCVERNFNVSRDLPAYKAVAQAIDDDAPSQPMEERHLDEPPQAAVNAEASRVVQQSPIKDRPSTGSPEHYLVRDLPTHSLFCEDVPANLAQAHFFARYESCRVALKTGVSVSNLLGNYGGDLNNYDDLWSHFAAISQHQTLPKRTDSSTWTTAIARSSEVILAGSLSFNKISRDALFHLTLEPIQSERSCRFQRAYGADRFLYLNVPSVRTIPKDIRFLKGQQEALARRYQQWLSAKHKFLGRTWRVLMVETKQSKKIVRQPNARTGQRLILFATEGVDLLPPSHSYAVTTPLVSRQHTSSSLYEVVNWFLPVSKNFGQAFCKVYSRLELGKRATLFPMDTLLI